MTPITEDPETLKEYQEEQEYHNETNPEEVIDLDHIPEPAKKPGLFRRALQKAAEVSGAVDKKVSEIKSSPTAQEAGKIIRDMAARSNATDGLGGDSGGGFDFRNMGRAAGDERPRSPQNREPRQQRNEPRGERGSRSTTVIKPDGSIVITHPEKQQEQGKKKKKPRQERRGGDGIGSSPLGDRPNLGGWGGGDDHL